VRRRGQNNTPIIMMESYERQVRVVRKANRKKSSRLQERWTATNQKGEKKGGRGGGGGKRLEKPGRGGLAVLSAGGNRGGGGDYESQR